MPRIYVAGPMQGLSEHGYPAFERAVTWLRQWTVGGIRGEPLWEVLSPHEVDNGEDDATRGKTLDHWDYMKKDLQMLVTCDSICLLDGWSKSRGAVQELNCAIAMGLTVWRFDETVAAPDLFYQIS